ncbi:MAG: LysR family transcriptional regulator [Pseudomonadales bacterium]|jgi:DNA-binding transcriptional LysR family regulator|nr:LysR family transcriptional regulator [Pseudomonadales bacterium]
MDQPVNLDALRVLDAIERHGSFAAAAEALHRVPSAVTYAIQRLEEELGLTLFDRSGHRATLTSAGRIVLDRGRDLLAASSALQATAHRLAAGWEPRVTLAIDSLIDVRAVLPLIRSFHEAHPEIEIALIEEVLGGVWDAVASGRADLAIGAPGTPPRGFATLPFGPAEFVYVASPTHPAAQRPGPLTPADLAEATAVVAADSTRSGAPRSIGVLDLRRRLTVPNLEWKLCAQRAGLGVGWVPRHRVRDALDAGELVTLALTETRPPETLHIAWRRDHDGRALAWFVDRLRQTDLDGSFLAPCPATG